MLSCVILNLWFKFNERKIYLAYVHRIQAFGKSVVFRKMHFDLQLWIMCLEFRKMTIISAKIIVKDCTTSITFGYILTYIRV